MKKQKLVLVAALALAFGATVANAGTVTGGVVLATEQAPAAAGTIIQTNNPVVYQFSGLPASGQAISAGTVIYAYVKLTGGTWNALIAGDITPSGFNAPPTVGAPIINTAKDIAAIPLTLAGAGTVVVPNTAKISIAGTSSIDVATAQTAAVTAAGSLDIVGAAPTGAFTVPTTVADSTATPVNIISTETTINGAVVATAETSQISTAASPFASSFTTGLATNKMNIATVTFTDKAGAKGVTYGAGVAPAATPTTTVVTSAVQAAIGSTVREIVVAPASGSSFTKDLVFSLTTGIDCTGVVAAVTVAATPTYAGAGSVDATTTSVKLTIPNGAAFPTSSTKTYVCVAPPATAASVSPAQFTVAATNTYAAGLSDAVSATNGYALAYDSKVVDVLNYVPVANTGWTQFIRIANTGAATTDISIALIDETTGLAGTSSVLIAGMKAGTAMTLNGTDIEAKVGTLAASARPRLRISGSTSGLAVQNMVFTPNGSFTNNSSFQ